MLSAISDRQSSVDILLRELPGGNLKASIQVAHNVAFHPEKRHDFFEVLFLRMPQIDKVTVMWKDIFRLETIFLTILFEETDTFFC